MTALLHGSNGTTVVHPMISAAGAKAVVGAAEAKATELGVPVVVVVVDTAGDLKALLGMDGAPKGATQWAIDKAITAAVFRTRTDLLAQGMEGAPASALASFMAQPHVTLVPAGLPLVVDGVVVGAIGASGGSPDQDQVVAQAAAAALAAR